MIDYLLTFPDVDAAHGVLDPLGFGFPPEPDGEGGTRPARWDDSRVLPVRIGVGETDGGTDPETGEPVRLPVYAAGYWLVVTTAAPDDALWSAPGAMREADRDAADRGEPFVRRDRFSAEQLATPYWVTPIWAGARYPFATPE